MSYDPDQYEALTSEGKGAPAFDKALAAANAATLCRAVNFAWDEFLDTATVIDPILDALTTRFGFTDDDIQATAEGREPKGKEARDALNLIPLLSFYAVKRVSGMVMCFPWAAEEIADAIMNKGVVGVIRGIQAVSTDAAESEAKRLFAAGQFEPSAIAQLEAQIAESEPAEALNSQPSATDSAPEGAASPFPMSETTSTYTLRDPNSLALHPCLDGMPELATDDPKFQGWFADIRDRGFDYPVIIDEQDRIIDGRHRRRIAAMLGIQVPTTRRAGAEAVEIVLSALMHRRHYSKGALAYMASPLFSQVVEASRTRRLANLQAGDSRKPTQSVIGKTVEQLSEELGFSLDLYTQAKKVREKFDDPTEYDWSELPRPTTYKRYFEPKLLAGEIGLGGVLQAIAGKEATQGQAKVTPKVATLFERGLQAFTTRFTTKWDKLSPEDRRPIVKSVATEVTKWPEDVRHAAMNALVAAAKHKPVDTAY